MSARPEGSALDEVLRARLRAASPRTVDAEARAAVSAILRPAREAGPAEILFIQRAEHPNDPWSGHMAFPGGRHEPDDESLEHTAIRETAEELGLYLPAHAERLGALDDLPTHTTGLVVRPFVFWMASDPSALTPNDEVAGVHWVDLESLMSGARDTTFELDWKGQRHRFPGYSVADRVVWGLTYRMLQDLFALVRG